MIYRGFDIAKNPKPIGTRAWDWEFCPEDNDGDQNGTGRSEVHCQVQIDIMLEEMEDENSRC